MHDLSFIVMETKSTLLFSTTHWYWCTLVSFSQKDSEKIYYVVKRQNIDWCPASDLSQTTFASSMRVFRPTVRGVLVSLHHFFFGFTIMPWWFVLQSGRLTFFDDEKGNAAVFGLRPKGAPPTILPSLVRLCKAGRLWLVFGLWPRKDKIHIKTKPHSLPTILDPIWTGYFYISTARGKIQPPPFSVYQNWVKMKRLMIGCCSVIFCGESEYLTDAIMSLCSWARN